MTFGTFQYHITYVLLLSSMNLIHLSLLAFLFQNKIDDART